MNLSKKFLLPLLFIALQPTFIQTFAEEIDQDLVDRYKNGDLAKKREQHAKFTHRFDLFRKNTEAEYKAANEAQKQLREAQKQLRVEKLKNDQDTQKKLLISDQELRSHLPDILQKQEILDAQKAQREVDQVINKFNEIQNSYKNFPKKLEVRIETDITSNEAKVILNNNFRNVDAKIGLILFEKLTESEQKSFADKLNKSISRTENTPENVLQLFAKISKGYPKFFESK
jgi:hypothetical protein